MKNFRLIAVSLMFAAILAVSATAQTMTKIVIIDTRYFDDTKAGITKYVAGMNTLEAEFKTVAAELQKLSTEIQTLQKDMQTIQTQLSATTVPVNEAQLRTSYSQKYADADNKTREYKFKEDSAKAQYERRLLAIMGPIRQDIGKAMDEYAKAKGYQLVLDAAKLDQIGAVLVLDPVADVTADFIKFYNARPATATK